MSSPYGKGQQGTVFIYSGQNGSPIPVLSQNIDGSALNLEGELLDGLTSFGACIEGNTDIDGNCHDYPHLPSYHTPCTYYMYSSLQVNNMTLYIIHYSSQCQQLTYVHLLALFQSILCLGLMSVH